MLMINWTQELLGESPQGSMDIFQQHLNVSVDRWVPVKKVKTSSYAGQKTCLDDTRDTTNVPQKTFCMDSLP